ncbi:hypothetical protein FHS18_001666 [Paenibacillus phyllosphaerae]|uniref:SbsA Ig-like domain-containing protein n=1 Tax=Paenibacillus phyllosphaerae TaxID=274593 RepID=A0A7W5FLZ8_9BACL|nr:Ig-like domain-containing protein [Paenibacillus phyllosphaerae]MBB3109603.1 hypothetical protein [Paenibacillus phyllosphaerae]
MNILLGYKRMLGVVLVFLILVSFFWLQRTVYPSGQWIEKTYPQDKSTSVSRDIKVSAQWKEVRNNNVAIIVRYKDEPNEYIPGGSWASGHGVAFKPETEFKQGKTVLVTVIAGQKKHKFSFTTEK